MIWSLITTKHLVIGQMPMIVAPCVFFRWKSLEFLLFAKNSCVYKHDKRAETSNVFNTVYHAREDE